MTVRVTDSHEPDTVELGTWSLEDGVILLKTDITDAVNSPGQYEADITAFTSANIPAQGVMITATLDTDGDGNANTPSVPIDSVTDLPSSAAPYPISYDEVMGKKVTTQIDGEPQVCTAEFYDTMAGKIVCVGATNSNEDFTGYFTYSIEERYLIMKIAPLQAPFYTISIEFTGAPTVGDYTNFVVAADFEAIGDFHVQNRKITKIENINNSAFLPSVIMWLLN